MQNLLFHTLVSSLTLSLTVEVQVGFGGKGHRGRWNKTKKGLVKEQTSQTDLLILPWVQYMSHRPGFITVTFPSSKVHPCSSPLLSYSSRTRINPIFLVWTSSSSERFWTIGGISYLISSESNNLISSRSNPLNCKAILIVKEFQLNQNPSFNNCDARQVTTFLWPTFLICQ